MNSYYFSRKNAETAASVLEKSLSHSITTFIGNGETTPLAINIELTGAGNVSVSCVREYSGYPQCVYDVITPNQLEYLTPEAMLRIRDAFAENGYDRCRVEKYSHIESFKLCSIADAIELAAMETCKELNANEKKIIDIINVVIND